MIFAKKMVEHVCHTILPVFIELLYAEQMCVTYVQNTLHRNAIRRCKTELNLKIKHTEREKETKKGKERERKKRKKIRAHVRKITNHFICWQIKFIRLAIYERTETVAAEGRCCMSLFIWYFVCL